jgi:hypothetical protein
MFWGKTVKVPYFKDLRVGAFYQKAARLLFAVRVTAKYESTLYSLGWGWELPTYPLSPIPNFSRGPQEVFCLTWFGFFISITDCIASIEISA